MSTYGGLFVTVEGGEGSGKSGIVQRLVDHFTAQGLTAVATREPGASPVGVAVRDVLLNPDGEMDARTEALLMAADRAEHVAQVVRPNLEAGHAVVCDRFMDSSVAYQGFGRGLGALSIRELSLWASNGLVPDVTVLLDVDPRVGLLRRVSAGGVNRLDLESVAFHRRVREGFLYAARMEPARFIVIDASGPEGDVAAAAISQVNEWCGAEVFRYGRHGED